MMIYERPVLCDEGAIVGSGDMVAFVRSYQGACSSQRVLWRLYDRYFAYSAVMARFEVRC